MEHVTSNIPASFVIARNDASSSQGMGSAGNTQMARRWLAFAALIRSPVSRNASAAS
jgi:hypothetical protein